MNENNKTEAKCFLIVVPTYNRYFSASEMQ
jgi:hypothetical protein